MNNKALFIINSLSNGGAERVCINMANELIKENFNVDFIILKPMEERKNNYEINKKINIYSLNCKSKSGLMKFIELFFKINKMNKIIKENQKNGKYNLITSHLPMANIITRFSIVKNKSIYVFHTKIEIYEKISHRLFTTLLNIFFKKKKIVCVSNGVRNEGINIYKMNEKFLKTIYNPLDLKTIEKKAYEKLDSDYGPYMLLVGRFNEAKRQDRAIEVFYKGKFYKNYKLLFCGTGKLEEGIKIKVKEYGLEDKVTFLEWQSNVYKWIKNADILLCTSDYEAFPMNLIEAFACKTKVVASNCDYGPSEIMLGEYKEFLVETTNVNDYIKKINEALSNYPTSENAILEKCKSSEIIKKYLNFFKEDIR